MKRTLLSILRGINVGGRRKILMADLKDLYEALNFTEVTTYIQSGNVVFQTEEKGSNTAIANKINTAIANKYDFDVPILVRTKAEIENTIATNPFVKNDEVDSKTLHVTFLAEMPEQDKIDAIKSLDFSPDAFEIIGTDVFIQCEKYGRTKLNNNFFEKKLKVSATTRNWKTVNKLLEMSNL